MRLANAIIETMMRGVICDGAGGTEVFSLYLCPNNIVIIIIVPSIISTIIVQSWN